MMKGRQQTAQENDNSRPAFRPPPKSDNLALIERLRTLCALESANDEVPKVRDACLAVQRAREGSLLTKEASTTRPCNLFLRSLSL